MEKFKKQLFMAVGISLIIIVGITIYTVDPSTWQALKNLNLKYLLIIFLAIILAWTINGLKLKTMAAGVGFKLPLINAIELGLVDRFFSNITPSGIGGQPVKILALSKFNITSGKASAIVIVELLLRLLFFALSLPFVFIKVHNLFVSFVSIRLLYIGIPLLIIALGAVIYFLLYKPHTLVKIFFWILNLKLIEKLLNSKIIYSWKRTLAEEIKIFYETIWLYLKEGKFQLFLGLILTGFLWIIRFSILYFIIRGFNLEVDLGFVILIQLLVYTVVLFIPVPGGSGVEVILVSLLHRTLPVSLIGITVASWRFFNYYTYIIFGGIITFKVFHLKKAVEEIE
jgi:hypothetical protein